MDTKFKNYYMKWLNGLQEEIGFWKKFMEERGGVYFYGYERSTSPNRKFELEEEIPFQCFGKEYMFIDVGAGPFSRCGRITDKVKLNALSVDPLASIYEILKKENHIDNGMNIKTGFVELLNRSFLENSFDMVHMSNSLDHCFDAVYGIFQLLYICKVGGKVILRHTENEAEKEQYEGLHQWNLSLHNPENSFIIWRGDKRYDISKLFEQYAEIDVYPDCIEQSETGSGWVHNKIVMKKTKNIEIPFNNYYDEMLRYTYDYLLLKSLQNVRKVKKGRRSLQELVCKRIADLYYGPETLIEKLKGDDIKKVDIYGMGVIGKNLYYLLKKYGVNINQIIDKNKVFYDGRIAVSLEEYEYKADVSKVIVTIYNERIDVIERLKTKVGKEKIVCIEEIIGNIELYK